jgi:hypothetical protein
LQLVEHFANENKKFYVVVDGLDHVWRERMNIEQMDHLFSYLLPCPKNVVLIVGTQRVSDLHLPARLLAQAIPSAWIEIPPLDEQAVHDWISGQDKAKRLRVPDYARRKDQRKETIDEVSRAFFKISRGHPLHLIYSFETLVRRGTIVTADEVKILPRCPDGDIRKYYKNLWQRLKPQAKKVLHLVAGSEFRWPVDGLRRCGGDLDEVDHLLEHRRTGILPFHAASLLMRASKLTTRVPIVLFCRRWCGGLNATRRRSGAGAGCGSRRPEMERAAIFSASRRASG